MCESKPILAVAGRFQVGKSTLINYLLDGHSANTGIGISTTKIPFLYEYGDLLSVWQAIGEIKRGSINWIQPWGDILNILEMAAKGSADGHTAALRITSNADILYDFSLLDLPGIDDKDESTNKAAEAGLRIADCCIVVLENKGTLHEREKGLLRTLDSELRIPYCIIMNCTHNQGRRWCPGHNLDHIQEVVAEISSLGLHPKEIFGKDSILPVNIAWAAYSLLTRSVNKDKREKAKDIEDYIRKKYDILPTRENILQQSRIAVLKQAIRSLLPEAIDEVFGEIVKVAHCN